jgi:protein-S-isoprenylcysteine O-methyltransferase Ste14
MKATNNGLPESWLDAYPLSRSSTMVRQLTSLVLPFVVVLVVPFLLLFDFRQFSLRIRLPFPIAQIVLGTILCTIGLLLLAATISRFARQGRGTLTPWDPPKHLVIQGPYAYTRNPMITGVAFVLLGEAVVFGALSIFIWFGIAVAVNSFYFKLSEEPGLVKRFGPEYAEYRRHVPMWIPRIKPWRRSNDAKR